MNNKEFILQLSKKTGYSPDDTQKMVKAVINGLVKEFGEGEGVNIADFGTFEIKKKMERIVVNPSTKQRMLVPPKLSLNFKPVQAIKDELKQRKGGA